MDRACARNRIRRTSAKASACSVPTRELGFGGLADHACWLESIEGPAVVLEPREFLDAASLVETAAWLQAAVSRRSHESFTVAAPCSGRSEIFMSFVF